MAVSGAKYPAEKDGVKITPPEGKSLLEAFPNRPVERDYLAWEHERNRAVRAGKWKLVASRGGAWELYDLDADRNERMDLKALHPDTVKELAARWDAWAVRCNVLPYPTPKKRP